MKETITNHNRGTGVNPSLSVTVPSMLFLNGLELKSNIAY